MASTKYKLGDLIEESFRKNLAMKYDVSSVRGISNNKQITETKADVDTSVIYKFYIVNPGEFIYNPRTTRMGDKVGLGYNDTDAPLLFSFNNIAFYIKESAKDIILPEYLYMYFNRAEFDRYAMINGWGSATELFSMEEMSDIDIDVPPLHIQQQYVDIYRTMKNNQRIYEKGLGNLKLSCDIYIENLRRITPSKTIGQYIECTDRKNSDKSLPIMGISNKQVLQPSESRTTGVDKTKYLQIDTREFAYSPIHINDGSIAFNDKEKSFLLSPIYKTFKIKNENTLFPEYLMLWFARSEFVRYCRFHAFGSARDAFDWEQMCEVSIPIPDIKTQKSIASIFKAYCVRKEINEKLKWQIANICPILIKGSLEEANK